MNVSVLDDFPVGIALPFHGTADLVPQGWIIYDGSEFNKLANPKNAVIFSSGRFPDYKGRMPEGYLGESDGPVASEQPGGIMAHNHTATSSFTGTAKAPTASFAGNALPAHTHSLSNSGSDTGSGKVAVGGGNAEGAAIHTDSVSAGTPSGTVTVASYTPAGTVSTTVATNGGTRNTVDRVICLWIGKLG